MYDYKPNDIIIDKVCDIWKQMLSNPKFDALGDNADMRDDPNGSMCMAQGMASVLAESCKATDSELLLFSTTLKTMLISKMKFDSDAKVMVFCDDGYYCPSLNVDYNPDMILRQAAEEAGISDNLFPWKTNMHFDDKQISLSAGYGSGSAYHYPLDNGKWLVTTLCGSEITKIMDYVAGGKPEFKVTD